MKKFLVLAILMVLIHIGYSQSIKTFETSQKTFVTPSLDQVIDLLEMDYQLWQEKMADLGYEDNTEPGKAKVYTKGQIGSITQAISKTDILVSIDWWNFMNDYRTLDGVKAKLKQYYSHNANDIDFYSYNGYIIGITISDSDDFFMERILIRRK